MIFPAEGSGAAHQAEPIRKQWIKRDSAGVSECITALCSWFQTRNRFESTRSEVESLMRKMKENPHEHKNVSPHTMEGYLFILEKRKRRSIFCLCTRTQQGLKYHSWKGMFDVLHFKKRCISPASEQFGLGLRIFIRAVVTFNVLKRPQLSDCQENLEIINY